MKPKNVGFYQSFWVASGIIGATVAAIGGGRLLLTYTDFDTVNTTNLHPLMTPISPIWVGAWWPGILGAAGCLMFISLLVICVPRYLDTSHSSAAKQDQANGNSDFW